MSDYRTTAEAAEAIGASLRTVQRLCRQHGIGQQHGRRVLLLTDADIERLRAVKQSGPGNPQFIAARKSDSGTGDNQNVDAAQ